MSAIANAGRHGVLVKSAVAMEQLADVDAAALDKTGTLAVGEPTVVAVRRLPLHEPLVAEAQAGRLWNRGRDGLYDGRSTSRTRQLSTTRSNASQIAGPTISCCRY